LADLQYLPSMASSKGVLLYTVDEVQNK